MYLTHIDSDIENGKPTQRGIQYFKVINTDPFVKQPFYFAIADNLEDFGLHIGYLY